MGQLEWPPPCHGGDRGFKSPRDRCRGAALKRPWKGNADAREHDLGTPAIVLQGHDRAHDVTVAYRRAKADVWVQFPLGASSLKGHTMVHQHGTPIG